MKTWQVALTFLLAAGLGRAAAPNERIYANLGTDFKKPQVLPETFFNPFRAQAPESALQKQESASVTNEAVTAAISHRGISGLVYAAAGRANKAIIGDQVFGIGEELTFPTKDTAKDEPDPLVAGASIYLLEVKPESLTVEIIPEGEPARRLTFPLRTFWRP